MTELATIELVLRSTLELLAISGIIALIFYKGDF